DEDLGPKARVQLHQALLLKPDCAEAHYVQGRIYWSPASGFDHERAIQEFHYALKSNPNLSEAHNWLGLVYQHVGLFENMDKELKEALRLNPDNSMAKFSAGAAHVLRMDYQKTIDDLGNIQDYYFPALIGYSIAQA